MIIINSCCRGNAGICVEGAMYKVPAEIMQQIFPSNDFVDNITLYVKVKGDKLSTCKF